MNTAQPMDPSPCKERPSSLLLFALLVGIELGFVVTAAWLYKSEPQVDTRIAVPPESLIENAAPWLQPQRDMGQ